MKKEVRTVVLRKVRRPRNPFCGGFARNVKSWRQAGNRAGRREDEEKIDVLVALGGTIRENESLFLTPEEIEKARRNAEKEQHRRDKETEPSVSWRKRTHQIYNVTHPWLTCAAWHPYSLWLPFST
ncbi:MAG: hypothetical protein ACLR8L_00285 [Oscillospiraceae bacterium]